jgi:Reeler domain
MKKVLLPLSIIALIFGMLSFRTTHLSGFQAAPQDNNGPAGGKTGAPGEQNCTSCHSGATQSGTNENLLVINNDIGFGITQYTPGATYTVNLTMASNPAKKGFQVTALNAANTMAGNFVAGANTQLKTATISGGQRKYATHKSSSNTSATQTWNWTWQAPATSEGAVTFYVATNKANNNNNDNGDVIYLSQHIFVNDDASVNEAQVENNFAVGYGVEKEELIISFSTLSIVPISLNLVDLQGKSVWSKKLDNASVGQNKEFVAVPKHIPNGMYVVHFFLGNKAYSAPISIQH